MRVMSCEAAKISFRSPISSVLWSAKFTFFLYFIVFDTFKVEGPPQCAVFNRLINAPVHEKD